MISGWLTSCWIKKNKSNELEVTSILSKCHPHINDWYSEINPQKIQGSCTFRYVIQQRQTRARRRVTITQEQLWVRDIHSSRFCLPNLVPCLIDSKNEDQYVKEEGQNYVYLLCCYRCQLTPCHRYAMLVTGIHLECMSVQPTTVAESYLVFKSVGTYPHPSGTPVNRGISLKSNICIGNS